MTVQEPPWTQSYFDNRDTKQFRVLSRLEIRKYLEGWAYNVGGDDDPEMMVLHAFGDRNSIISWFNTSNIQYDDEYAVEIAEKLCENE